MTGTFLRGALFWAAGVAALGAGAPSCSAPSRKAYTVEELRAALIARVPELGASEVEVPFRLDPASIERARVLVARLESRADQARALKDALFDPGAFGLVYAEGVTTPAAETLRTRRGNCLSLAAVYVGLARAVGLQAFFLDASSRVQQVRQEEEVLVKAGHVTAAVETEKGKVALDFGGVLGGYLYLRVMDDLEATAHFYNNRGYERIAAASAARAPVPWEAVASEFRLAARVKPDFAQAWNNLGVAYGKLGRLAEARDCYRLALALDPGLVSPRVNLGLLELGAGRADEALSALETAREIDPDSPRVAQLRAEALLALGRDSDAVAALKIVLTRQPDNARARALLRATCARLGPSVECPAVRATRDKAP